MLSNTMATGTGYLAIRHKKAKCQWQIQGDASFHPPPPPPAALALESSLVASLHYSIYTHQLNSSCFASWMYDRSHQLH